MNLNEAINWLETRPRFKDKVSLDKMILATKKLGNPQDHFKSIHITGTNGKGSVAHYLSSVLAHQYKVGLFISPYIIKFNERIQINNDMIDDETLLNQIVFIKDFSEAFYEQTNEHLTFFELLTLMAFKYFREEKVDYAIIEVGIGGALDATNVITPILSIITTVGLDHQKQLGNTLESILLNKLGIVKEGVPLITGVLGFNELIDAYLGKLNSKVYYLDTSKIKLIKPYLLEFKFEYHTYKPSLQGLYQMENISLSVMALNLLFPKMPVQMIKDGIKEATNPARFEIIEENPTIILDGAHNKEAINNLDVSLKTIFKDKKIKVLFACMQDKPFNEMLASLSEITNDITLTTIDYHRALDINSEELLFDLPRIKDPIEAFNKIYNLLDKDDVLVITGSLYFASFMRNYLIKR